MRLLFVCLGNICRSPTAEAVMIALVAQRGLSEEITCDSAGTSGWHVGEQADARMRRHAEARGYCLTSRSRQVRPADFAEFDYLVAMDDSNCEDLRGLERAGGYNDRIVKMTDYCRNYQVDAIPDPYYGGSAGFERVIDLLEDACTGLLDTITRSDSQA